MTRCELCPRRCGVNRAEGQRGYCQAGGTVEVYRYGLHQGEEPPVSGTKGSGTVFFSRCTLSCVYCQNYPWSQEGQGRPVSVDELAEMLRSLYRDGCHNWNLVSPTPWLPWIHEAWSRVVADGLSRPIVYNTSGFERVEQLQAMAGWINVYLSDLRYARDATAKEGSDCTGYVWASRAALLEMWRQTGPLKLDEEGVAETGTICRLLVLPGRADEAVSNLEWLAGAVGTEIPVSVMAQYTPAYKALSQAPWNRRPTKDEYGIVVDAMERLGFSEGWIQEYETPVQDNLVGFKMSPG
jgi:putative pyruvate formate lyase activating enzyme